MRPAMVAAEPSVDSGWAIGSMAGGRQSLVSAVRAGVSVGSTTHSRLRPRREGT
jgi:hypothetical protein